MKEGAAELAVPLPAIFKKSLADGVLLGQIIFNTFYELLESHQILSDAQFGFCKSILQPHYYCPLLTIGYLTSITATVYLLILH